MGSIEHATNTVRLKLSIIYILYLKITQQQNLERLSTLKRNE